jgi:hypothetical protein
MACLFGVSWWHTYRHTVGLLWTSDQPVADTSAYTGQHKRQTSMPSAEFKPAIRANKQPKTYALNRASTLIGLYCDYQDKLSIWWAGHVAGMERWEMCTVFWIERLKWSEHSENLDIIDRIILKWILLSVKKFESIYWINLAHDMTGCGLLWIQ